MQQHKIVEDYLNSVIPQKISDSTKAELRAEIECHIYDKAEFYMEIGYDEEAAFGKAVEEMGETEEVKAEFESIYKDSTLKGIFLFLGMCTLNLLSVTNFGLGYWYFVEPSMHHFPSIIELTVFLVIFIFSTVYTIKCCRHKLHKQLSGITAVYAVMALGSVITSGLFYPVLNAGYLIYCYITNGPTPETDIAFPINILVLFLYAFVSFMSLIKDYRYRAKPYRISLKQITIILSVIGVCFVAVYGFAYVKYEYPYFDEAYYEKLTDEEDLSDISAEAFNVYNSVKIGDDVKETQKLLKGKGFSDKNLVYENRIVSDELQGFLDELFSKEEREEGIEKYITSYSVFSYDPETYLMDRISKNVGENKYLAYYYTIPYGEEESWDDFVSCVLISYDSEGKIDYKLFLPDVEDCYFSRYYYSRYLGEDTHKWFEGISKGDNAETVMEFIRNTQAFVIEDEKKKGEGTVKTYKIYLDCYYELEPSISDFLVGYPPDSVSYSYEFDIQAENGVITDFGSIED